MTQPCLVLAVDDDRLAAELQRYLERAGQTAVPSRLDALSADAAPDAPARLLLAAAALADSDVLGRLVHESYWQQWPVEVLLLGTGDAVHKELLHLEPYTTACLRWPEDGAELLAQLRRDPGAPASEAELRLVLEAELREQTPSLTELAGAVALAAAHDVHVLLGGETGTGKTYLARRIHEHSRRRNAPLLVVPCGSLAASLVESELFGHARGAFTGAERGRAGKLEAAGAGTLLLDEIDTLGLEAQAKLLRVVETGEYEPVGSNRRKLCQARFLFATNVDLEEAVAAGRFRKDLYYRINVLALHLPPLRERPQDVLPLALAMTARFARQFAKPAHAISAEAQSLLTAHAWPGNIRQLENVIQQAVLRSTSPVLHAADLPAGFNSAAPTVEAPSLLDTRHCFERNVIQQALATSNNNRVRAASALGISRVTLYKKMKKYGLMAGQREAV